MIQPSLFEDDFGEGGQEIDDTQITTTILYFSDQELKEFKRLCKKGIEKMFQEDRFEKGNIPDLLLTLLREYHGKN